MGLGGLKLSWQRQTKDFAHTQADKYSVLLIDNRGIGGSDTPWLRYSTSEMARDVLEVLDHVGWNAPRSVHAVGISMGGMITQELCLLVPERIASVAFVSTAARLVNTVGFMENLRRRASLLKPKGPDETLAATKENLFTKAYVSQPDDTEFTTQAFPTAGDRYAAGEVFKRNQDPSWFSLRGFLSQIVAAGWHHKSPEQLTDLADKVGRERIMVIHGTADNMITVPHAHTLIEDLSRGAGVGKGVRSVIMEGQAHVIPIEKRKEFNQLLEENVQAGLRANQ